MTARLPVRACRLLAGGSSGDDPVMVTVLVAVIAAGAGLGGGWLAGRRDRERWRRDLVAQAYLTCLRSALHLGREVGAEVQGFTERAQISDAALDAFYDEGITAMQVLGSRRAYELADTYATATIDALRRVRLDNPTPEEREQARQGLLGRPRPTGRDTQATRARHVRGKGHSRGHVRVGRQ